MAQQVRGVVARSKGAPVSIETIVVPDPGPGEAVVRCRPAACATPTCTIARAASTTTSRSCSGHEAAGVVESVGEGVTNVVPGDFVILNWRAVCGTCRSCLRGRPWICFNTFNATQKMTLTDGTVLSPALGIGAFVEKTLVAAGQCTKVDPAVPATTAGLLGCGVMAGIGAAINTGNVGRGDSVAVFGCGGVGDAAIAGARLAGAHTIIAVDIDDRKLEWAKEFGATHTCNSQQRPTPSSTSSRSPAATAPTSASRRSAIPRSTSRRSRPATWPAPWCWSACRDPTWCWSCRSSRSSAAAAR